ncbi:hypothetical protein HDG35_006508 [Paraburkholderia sp. JPY681]|nr:hypothetical protein [Paraburkholderia atlantica]
MAGFFGLPPSIAWRAIASQLRLSFSARHCTDTPAAPPLSRSHDLLSGWIGQHAVGAQFDRGGAEFFVSSGNI